MGWAAYQVSDGNGAQVHTAHSNSRCISLGTKSDVSVGGDREMYGGGGVLFTDVVTSPTSFTMILEVSHNGSDWVPAHDDQGNPVSVSDTDPDMNYFVIPGKFRFCRLNMTANVGGGLVRGFLRQ